MSREKARALLGNNELIVQFADGQSGQYDRDSFCRVVELAAESGATHVFVGLVPFRYGSWVLPDNSDPYAAWSNHQGNFFRVCPPEPLQEWIPISSAEPIQALFHEKLEILRPYGLKGTSYAIEPHWLPEGVYRAHPSWRGPQCELGRIARRPYFAPNIDDPEVLALYREAVREYAKLFPEIDQFHFLMNDSGSGVSWSPNIYPGMNGPAKTRTINRGKRIARWLNVMKEGADEAGVDLRLNAHYAGMMVETCDAARLELKDNLYVRGGSRDGKKWDYAGASFGEGIWSSTWPVPGLGDVEQFIAGLQGIYTDADKKGARANINVGTQDIDKARTVIKIYKDNPGTGYLHQQKLLLQAAETFCGDRAETLVGVWKSVAKSVHCVSQIRQKGFCAVLPFAGVSMRWLIRPLVPQPEKLTESEKEYYTRFLFWTGVDEADVNLGFVLGKAVFRGESAMWMARWCLVEALGHANGAYSAMQRVIEAAPEGKARDAMRLYAARIKAFSCCLANAKNCIMYQYALDIRNQPQYGPNQMDYDDNIIYDLRAVNFRKIAREELDNTAELISVIKSMPEKKVVMHADCPEAESVFVLGPDLVGDLERKMNIMMDHWPEYEYMYPATKVYDYEPEPKGNIFPADTPES